MHLQERIEAWLRGEEFDHVDDLVALGAEAVPVLIDLAGHAADEMTRARALEVLGRLGDPRAVPVLTGALNAESSLEKLTAARALAAVSGSGAVEALAGLLDHPDPALAKVVVRSLASIGNATALAALERAENTPASEFLQGEIVAAVQTIRERLA